jgi:shikimate kinase
MTLDEAKEVLAYQKKRNPVQEKLDEIRREKELDELENKINEIEQAEKSQSGEEISKTMDRIEEIREKIGECDDIIIEQLAVRMSHIQEIISYKKATGIPILQPEQEKKQTDALAQKLGDNEFEEEILDIFKYIMKNSRRIQAKSLFDYNIFLIGFMGAGKSTIAGELKDKLEMDRVEMDQMIVEKQGMSISEIFDEYGEAYFRNLESNTLIELQKRKQTIVSCGGGVVMREENTDHMKKNGRVVLLTAKPETIYERVKDSDERPILNDHMNVEFISSLMDKRKERYEAVADITVATDGKNVTQICEEIISKLIALDNAKEEQEKTNS